MTSLAYSTPLEGFYGGMYSSPFPSRSKKFQEADDGPIDWTKLSLALSRSWCTTSRSSAVSQPQGMKRSCPPSASLLHCPLSSQATLRTGWGGRNILLSALSFSAWEQPKRRGLSHYRCSSLADASRVLARDCTWASWSCRSRSFLKDDNGGL